MGTDAVLVLPNLNQLNFQSQTLNPGFPNSAIPVQNWQARKNNTLLVNTTAL